MKIFSAIQLHEWDQFTIEKEPVSSIDLMERAASKCCDWMLDNFPAGTPMAVFCGKGNNGGDGLAIARMLISRSFPVTIYILEFGFLGTEDFQSNLTRIHKLTDTIHFIQDKSHFPSLPADHVIIDALYGSGMNRPPTGNVALLIRHINDSGLPVISIDLPAGMYADRHSLHQEIIRATHTLTFQSPKLAFMLPENEPYTGHIHVLDISLHPGYTEIANAEYELLTRPMARALYRPRKRFAHKGDFGHALIVAGSKGKMGAACLATKACMRTGAGLATALVPRHGNDIIQVCVPEAMTITYSGNEPVQLELDKYSSIGMGPGLGTTKESVSLISAIFSNNKKPMLLDADALNCLAINNSLLSNIPPGSVLTPHPKEFDRLFGNHTDHFSRIQTAKDKASKMECIIIVKGQHSFIAIPGDTGYFNSTGNPGMATAGSGDVLSGIVTGLLAQGYSSVEAALLGVYIHGMAGDIALSAQSAESMLAGDLIGTLGAAFRQLNETDT